MNFSSSPSGLGQAVSFHEALVAIYLNENLNLSLEAETFEAS